MKGFFAFAAFSLALVTPAAIPTARAQSCQDLLANNSYRCQIKTELGAELEACFQFSSPGSLSGKIDLAVDGGPELLTTLECECKATGDFNNPQFNKSRKFLCGNEQYGDAIEGKAEGGGKKITKGQLLYNVTPNLAYVFQCTLDATCQIR